MKFTIFSIVLFLLLTTTVFANQGNNYNDVRLVGSVTYYTTAVEVSPNRYTHRSTYNESFVSMEACDAFLSSVLDKKPDVAVIEVINDDGRPYKSKLEYSLIQVSTLQCLPESN